MYCGAVADGINRRYTKKTGLCFKCNDFSGNLDDIFITKDPGIQLSADHSIALHQGYDYQNDSMPAGNTFSSGSNYSIENEVSPIIYHYHQHFAPQYKIIPDPVSVQSVGKSVVSMTSYSKTTSCAPWIGNSIPPPGDLLLAIDSAAVEISLIQSELDMQVDQGNTVTLNSEVLMSVPDSSFLIYETLLDNSPFLSDTVLKSSIYREPVLPNSMLRDILVANPQSAKSSEIIGKIGERFIPMPDNMLAEIIDGINLSGAKDELDEELSSKQDEWGLAFQRIQQHYLYELSDLITNDSLKALYSSISSLEAKLRKYNLLLEENNLPAAANVLEYIPIELQLSSQENLILSDFSTLHDFYSGLYSKGKSVVNCDSSETSQLVSLLNHDFQFSGAIARNILIARGGYQYFEPVNLPSGNEFYGPTSKDSENSRSTKNRITLFPNPSEQYFIVDYECSGNNTPSDLIITDLQGKLVKTVKLCKSADQKVVTCEELRSGVYIVSIRSKDSILMTSKFVKI